MFQLFAHIECDNLYKILNSKRGMSEIISIVNVNSVTRCVVECTTTQGCYNANFRNATICELLGKDIVMTNDPNTKFIRTY